MVDPTPPIVVDENGDIEVYPTVAMAGQALEAIDVIEGSYEMFDSEGRQLLLVAHGDLVSIELPRDSHSDPAQLEFRLRRYIKAVGVERLGGSSLKDASLSVMIQTLLVFQRGEHRTARKWSLRAALRRFRPRGWNA